MTLFMRCARMRLAMELDSRDFSRGTLSRILHKLKGVEPGGPPHFVVHWEPPLEVPFIVHDLPFREPMPPSSTPFNYIVQLIFVRYSSSSRPREAARESAMSSGTSKSRLLQRSSIWRRSFFVGRPAPLSRLRKNVSTGARSFAISSAGV